MSLRVPALGWVAAAETVLEGRDDRSGLLEPGLSEKVSCTHGR